MKYLLATLLAVATLTRAALPMDRVVVRRDGKENEVIGKCLVEAADGGLLIQGVDDVFWTIQPDDLVERKTDDREFKLLSRDELEKVLLKELPAGFQVYATQHYLICYNTTRSYAQWCGSLYERLFRGFLSFWKNKGLELTEPDYPLIAIVFDSPDSYAAYAAPDLGDAASAIVGYYNMKTNRIIMHDLAGLASLRDANAPRSSAKQINQILARPEAEPTVATIIHEATHQLAFNTGLHERYADIPLWVTEGLAIYFESPDLKSDKGWRTIGGVNRPRLAAFRESLGRRTGESLKSLIADDKRFRDTETGPEAYAEAWAFNYYLMRKKPKEYVRFLAKLKEKPRLIWDKPEVRLAEFHAVFGDDWQGLTTDFLRTMSKVR